ncbi:alpha/beta fold hydrolase [Candidatus Poribacteria bacterium]|nr:alpha/beta fold hydrolase [Candidatus Poribacteria bacterium]
MPKILINGIDIHYQTRGKGPNVTLIHGLASNMAFWYFSVFSRLIRNFRVTIYDLRGHGYSGSTVTGYKPYEMANDLELLLDNLNIENSHLVGHSYGGLIALHYAVKCPDKVSSIILADTGMSIPYPKKRNKSNRNLLTEIFETEGLNLDRNRINDIDYLIHKTNIIQKNNRNKDRQGLVINLNRIKKLSKSTTIMRDFSAMSLNDLKRILDLHIPIKGIYGEKSHNLYVCNYLSKHMKDFKYAIIPNTRHFHPIEQTDKFLEILLGYLNQ